MITPYQQHQTLNHWMSRFSPNGVDTVEQCNECGQQWLINPTFDYPITLPAMHVPRGAQFYFVLCKTGDGPWNVAVKSDANTTIFEALCQEALKRGLIIECGSLRILEEITEEEFLDLT